MTQEDISPIAVPLKEEVGGGRGSVSQDAQNQEFDVLIHAESNMAEEATSRAQEVCETVASSYGGMVTATVTSQNLYTLANSDPIRKVEPDDHPMEHATSEGVADTDTDAVQSLGVTGDGATIAIIDTKFNPDNSDISDSVVAQIGSGFESGTSGLHGTACAEIVHDMAPDADLVLASTSGSGGFASLMDDIEFRTDTDVITMSLGYKPTIRLDGQDYLSDRITEFTNNGGLFSVSAGNEATDAHFDREWTDTSGNGYLEFDDQGTEFFEVTTTNSDQEVVVQSDADWSTDQGYKIEVYDSDQSLINEYDRTTTPAQSVPVPGSGGSTTTSYIKIRDVDMNGDEHLDFFVWGNDISFPVSTSERSIGIPATSPDANTLATGAVYYDNDSLEPFSSRGPTQDGRRGVDITAPDGVDTIAYSDSFFGTSAAAPHVAGAAALLMNLGGLTNDDVREALLATGDPTANETPVNRKIGYGYLDTKGGFDDIIGVLENWSTNRGPRVQHASPAVTDERVFAADLGTTLTAYDRASGSVDWETTRDGQLSDSSPLVYNGQVIVGNGGGTVVSYSASGGSQNWSVDTGSAVTSSPAEYNGTVFVGTNDGAVYAIVPASGDVLWSVDVGGPVYSDLSVAAGTVCLTTDDGAVMALDTSDGNDVWRVETDTELGESSPLADTETNNVYVAADDVYVLALSDGSEQGSASYGGTIGSSPASESSSSTFYVGDADGTVHAFDGSTGNSQWTFSADGPIAADPTVNGGRVTVATTAGTLYVLDSSGSELGRTSLPAGTRSSPTIDGNDTYLGCRDGSFLCL